MSLKNSARLAISLTLGAIFLYFALRKADWKEVLAAFNHASPAWLAAAFLAQAGALTAKSLRLMALAEGAWRQPGIYAKTIWLGLGCNLFIPLRAGEAVKVVYMAKRAGLGYLRSVLIVFAERVLDLTALAGLIFIVMLSEHQLFKLWFDNFSAAMQAKQKIISFVLAAIGIIILLALLALAANAGNIKKRLQEKGKELRQKIAEIKEAMAKRLALAAVWTLLAWLLDASFIAITALGFGPLMQLSFSQMLFCQLVLVASFLPSVTPGALGLYELMGLWALTLMGKPQEISLAMLLAAHGILYIVLLVGVIYALFKETWVLKEATDGAAPPAPQVPQSPTAAGSAPAKENL